MYEQSLNGEENELCATESFSGDDDGGVDFAVELDREFNALDNEDVEYGHSAGVDSGQLSISYAGHVYVFDNVAHEKVKKIIYMNFVLVWLFIILKIEFIWFVLRFEMRCMC